MKFLKLTLAVFCCLFARNVQAQEMWGIANSNYAGTMGMRLNPAGMAFLPAKFEISILSGDVFLQNNYVYFAHGSRPYRKMLNGTLSDTDIRDHYTTNDKNAFAHLLLNGPSAIVRLNNFAVGIHAGVRADVSVRDVDYRLAKFIYEGTDFVSQQQLDLTAARFKANALGMAEVGLSAAQQMDQGFGDKLSIGVTVNYLMGMDGLYINNGNLDYRFDDQSYLAVADVNTQMGYALPADGATNYTRIRGRGVSTTIGFEYVKNYKQRAYDKGRGKNREKKYDYRFGASVIDAGYVNFNTQTKVYDYSNRQFVWSGFDTTAITGVNNAAEVVSDKIFDNPAAGLTARTYKAGTPTAVSAQFDYSVSPSVYVNASVIHPVALSANSVRRPAQVSVTPRYERRQFEVAMPVSLYEYNTLRAGLAVRLGPLVLGSDYLNSMTGISEFNGFDFYFGLKFMSDGWGKGGKRKRGTDYCPAY